MKDVESYTYLRLKTKDGEIWAAVARAPVRKGAEVTIMREVGHFPMSENYPLFRVYLKEALRIIRERTGG